MSASNPSWRPPTLEEVASLAGVGRGTASRVVNGSPNVSERARAKVEQAVATLGYVPNLAARALVTRRTDSVALVISEAEDWVFSDPYFSGVIRGVSTVLTTSGRQLLLAMVHTEAERTRLERYLQGQHVDGVMLLSLHGTDPLPVDLERIRLPTVLGGRPSGSRFPCWVDVDNAFGAQAAVSHLLGLGRRRVATICGPLDMEAGLARRAGYETALHEHGFASDPDLVAFGDFTVDSGRRAMAELLDHAPDLDAVFAASDLMAIGALAELASRGRRVPVDVAVVGFDDAPIAEHTSPPLTTIHQPVDLMGEAMAEMLIRQIEHEPGPKTVLLSTHLVRRASA